MSILKIDGTHYLCTYCKKFRHLSIDLFPNLLYYHLHPYYGSYFGCHNSIGVMMGIAHGELQL